MTQDTSQIVDRLARVLVEEVRARRPELMESSFTVAEIYQNLVPYRSHRDRIGVEMNADYEHALMRLLAGEGDYLTLESRTALRQIRQELDSLNPDTSVYRDFAAVEARLNPAAVPEVGGGEAAGGGAAGPDRDGTAQDGAAGDGDVASVETDFFSEGSAPAPSAPDPEPDEAAGEAETEFSFVDEPPSSGDRPPAEGVGEGPAAPEAAARDGDVSAAETGPDAGDEAPADADASCRWCRGALPDRDDLRFCPHCGSSVDRAPCPDCGAELDPEWRFCVACGAEVGEA